jgi:hypothetical protein
MDGRTERERERGGGVRQRQRERERERRGEIDRQEESRYPARRRLRICSAAWFRSCISLCDRPSERGGTSEQGERVSKGE